MISSYILPVLIFVLLVFATIKKTKPYNSFVDGAKESIDLIVDIFAYIVAVVVVNVVPVKLAVTLPLASMYNVPVPFDAEP